jgi:hypothetical protein
MGQLIEDTKDMDDFSVKNLRWEAALALEYPKNGSIYSKNNTTIPNLVCN